MEDYEVEEAKQAAVDALSHYSILARAALAEGIAPAQMRLRLMKDFSGMPSSPPFERLVITPPANSVPSPTLREPRPLFPAAEVNPGGPPPNAGGESAAQQDSAERLQAGGSRGRTPEGREVEQGTAMESEDDREVAMAASEKQEGAAMEDSEPENGRENATSRGQLSTPQHASMEGHVLRLPETGGSSQLASDDSVGGLPSAWERYRREWRAAREGSGPPTYCSAQRAEGSGVPVLAISRTSMQRVEEFARTLYMREGEGQGESARSGQRAGEAEQARRDGGSESDGEGPSGGASLGDRQ